MRTSKKRYTGINIQWPISNMILNGLKTIETRTYPLPQKHIGAPLAMIETPGRSKAFKSRIVGIIVFENSFKYQSKKEFYEDFEKHRVDASSPWAWHDKPKWGWKIKSIKPIKAIPAPKRRGYIFTSQIDL